ncbi:MAG: hypothetical protein K6G42_07350 [Lachnospiraceae bacterium]|nr:hypothetical protein [Lachnospiraceae bacterium]
MDIKRVAPETTDIIRHVNGNGSRSNLRNRERTRRSDTERPKHRDDDLVFGLFSKRMLGYITLGILFVISLIFGVIQLGMTVPVYVIVLVSCTLMGILLSGSPGFVSVIMAALLLVVGAITSLFPAVAIGVAMLVASSMIVRGD